jgi:3-phosphoshikimate 1-carboxyvinyltransferase
MGCKPAVQEAVQTSYGASGMVQLQRYTPVGRKCECQPLLNFVNQLPAMVVLSCFAEGQSIVRELEEVRQDATDALVQLCYCITLLGCRHGEMPDGIVIDGARQFDGFDLKIETPAGIAGSWAVAGLKCIGKTTIAADTLLQRWPQFKEMLDSVCEYRV